MKRRHRPHYAIRRTYPWDVVEFYGPVVGTPKDWVAFVQYAQHYTNVQEARREARRLQKTSTAGGH